MPFARKVIRVSAMDSPSVRFGLAQVRAGLRRPPECLVISEDNPHGCYSREEYERLVVKWIAKGCQKVEEEILVPGVLTWSDFVHRMATWNQVRKHVGLAGLHWEGADILLYPPAWLDRANQLHEGLKGKKRQAKGIGIDPAEGGDKTAMAAVDEWGLIELVSKRTPDTSVITREALAFMRKHAVDPSHVCFDRGGGGFQHVCNLRAEGHAVRSIGFGEKMAEMPKRGMRPISDRREIIEERYAYVNRRAQLFVELHLLLDPGQEGQMLEETTIRGFAIGRDMRGKGDDATTNIMDQMRRIPLLYDSEGRYRMLPKNRKESDEEGVKSKCLIDLIGHSPDELDAMVLAVHGMLHEDKRAMAGALT